MFGASPATAPGDQVNLLNCDREPVHTPGNIQPFGALVVVRRLDGRIVQASANLSSWLGRAAEAVVGQEIRTLLASDASAEVLRLAESGRLEAHPMHVWTLPHSDSSRRICVSAHTLGEFLLLEFEPDDAPVSIGGNTMPLKHSLERLEGGLGLQEYCRRLADEVHRLTQFDRVMVYQFKDDLSGEVVAETVREDLPRYLGLNYPAADIPAPARAMYRKMWVRVLPDIRQSGVPLIPVPVSGPPMDLSYSTLRGVSPIHVEYLKNMGVVATMSLSLIKDGALWGLVACHHYSPHRLPIQVRAACEIIAQFASLQLTAAEARDNEDYRTHSRQLHDAMIARAAGEGASLSTLVNGQPGLLQFVPSTGVALRFQAQWTVAGFTPAEGQLEELSRWLAEQHRGEELFATEQLANVYPPAEHWSSFGSGLLAARLSLTRQDVMLWFRAETSHTVRWAGDPHDKPIVYGPHGPRLHPRKSFEVWRESVRGRSIPWTRAEKDVVRLLRLSVLELIVNHGESLARLNRQLEASNDELDSFAYVASHDLKEPLRGIFNNAQNLLDSVGGIDGPMRTRAENVLRLTHRMEGLIESLLHYSRVGRLELSLQWVDMNEVLDEALDMLTARVEEAGIEVRIPRRLPSIQCDHVRIRELFLNLISNAIKYNVNPSKWVEIGYHDPDPSNLKPIVLYVKDNGIGIKSKFFEQIFTIFKRLHGRNDYGGGSGAGLTIARRIVERHGGCIWIESVLHEGSTFYFTLSGEKGLKS